MAVDDSMTIRRRASFAMSRRSVRFVWTVAILAFLGVALVLGFVVSLASGEPAMYERNFVWLFWLNSIVAVALLVVLVGATIRLGLRWRSGKFGSRMRPAAPPSARARRGSRYRDARCWRAGSDRPA